MFDFQFEGFNFLLQVFIFPGFKLDKLVGQFQLALHPFRGQMIYIRSFIGRVFEMDGLDQSLIDQGIQQVIGLSQAEFEPFGQHPLGEGRGFLQNPEGFQVIFIHFNSGNSAWSIIMVSQEVRHQPEQKAGYRHSRSKPGSWSIRNPMG